MTLLRRCTERRVPMGGSTGTSTVTVRLPGAAIRLVPTLLTWATPFASFDLGVDMGPGSAPVEARSPGSPAHCR